MRNQYLPVDILHVIFSYYEETPEYLLETLLLVCRFWNFAALECKDIWSKLWLNIEEGPTASFWSRQLPRRLERSGPNSPIFFTLILDPLYPGCRSRKCLPVENRWYRDPPPPCNCYNIIKNHIRPILSAVLGTDGSLCARWREIDIRCLSSDFPQDIPFFSYPIPQLVSLNLDSIVYRHFGNPFLPSRPSLQNIGVLHCTIPFLPDTSKATTIRFAGAYNNGSAWPSYDIGPAGLEDAEQVRCLELEVRGIPSQPYRVPINLLFLERLRLAGDILPENMDEVQTPALRELSLRFDTRGEYKPLVKNLLSCNGIPFQHVLTLTITFNDARRVDLHDAYWDDYYALLRVCTNLKKLSGDRLSTIFLLRMLRDDCIGAGPLTQRTVIVSNGEKWKEIGPGQEERLREITTFTAVLGWPKIKEDRREFMRDLYPRSA